MQVICGTPSESWVAEPLMSSGDYCRQARTVAILLSRVDANDGVLEQRREDENETGRHPNVNCLNQQSQFLKLDESPSLRSLCYGIPSTPLSTLPDTENFLSKLILYQYHTHLNWLNNPSHLRTDYPDLEL